MMVSATRHPGSKRMLFLMILMLICLVGIICFSMIKPEIDLISDKDTRDVYNLGVLFAIFAVCGLFSTAFFVWRKIPLKINQQGTRLEFIKSFPPSQIGWNIGEIRIDRRTSADRYVENSFIVLSVNKHSISIAPMDRAFDWKGPHRSIGNVRG